MKVRFEKWILEDRLALLVILLGTGFRLFDFTSWSLTNDELSAMTRLDFPGFMEMMKKGVRDNDMHPPGVQAFLWFWTHVFGTGEFWFRLPFVLMGGAGLVFMYLSGSIVFGKPSALLATTWLAFLHFPVLYSQLARPYSPGLLFSLMTFYGMARIVWRDSGWNRVSAFWFIAGGVGCMYSHYFSFLFAGLVGIAGLFYLKGRKLLKYLGCGLLMFIFFLPALPVFLAQVSVGGLGGPEGWLGKPDPDALFNYLKYGFNDQLVLLILTLIFLVFVVIVFRKQLSFSSRQLVVFLLFITPALIAYFYSIKVNPVFQYSVLLFSFPMLLLLLGSFYRPPSTSWVRIGIPFVLFAFLSVSAYSAYGLFRQKQFAPFRDVAEKCREYMREYVGRGGMTTTVNVIHPNYIRYYTGSDADSIPFSQYICNKPAHWVELSRIVDTSKSKFFLHAWSNNYHAPETEMIIRGRYPFAVQRDTFFNAGVVVFAMDSSQGVLPSPSISFRIANGFEDLKWENEVYCRTDSVSANGRWCMRLLPDQMYSPGLKTVASRLGFVKGATYMIACKTLHLQDWREAKLVVSIERKGQSVLWRGIPLSDFPSPAADWSGFYAGYKLQEDVLPDDTVVVYFYNPAGETFFVDDFRMEVIPPEMP